MPEHSGLILCELSLGGDRDVEGELGQREGKLAAQGGTGAPRRCLRRAEPGQWEGGPLPF